jgi:hypothetical protein
MLDRKLWHPPEFNMANRTAKLVSAIFAGILAGTAITTISSSLAYAADECLAGPKDKTPQGSHWYYRIDHATKRHCWYLGDEREKLSQTSSSAPAKPISPNPEPSPKNETAMQRSIADAHAELASPQLGVEQQTSVATGQRTLATAVNPTNIDTSQPANAWDANTQRSLIASRWPDSGLASSNSPEPTTTASDTNVQASSADAPPSVAAAVPLTAADSSPASQAGSIQMLLIVIAGALALAGAIGAAVFRFGGKRQTGRHEIGGDRRAIWDSVDTAPPSPAAYTRRNPPMRRVDRPRELGGADDSSDRIVEMLAQLRRSGAN